MIQDVSASESSEYEDIKLQSSDDKSISSVSMSDDNEKQFDQQKPENQINGSSVKDLYGQRHIAYFDPSFKFEHVEPIEHEDSVTRMATNGHQMKITFQIPPPPPIDDNSEEHIYEDIPNIIPIPEISNTTSVQQQSTQIIDNECSTAEQSQLISSSQNSLDDALNNVEQWSDIIADFNPPVPSSLRRISQLSSSINEYVNEQYLNHRSDVSSSDIWYISLPDQSTQDILFNGNHVFHHELNDADQQITLIIQPSTAIDQNKIETESVRKQEEEIHLSNGIDHVIETIHVGDELFEAKKTVITGIQAPNTELLSSNYAENQSDSSFSLLATEKEELPVSIAHKIEEPFEILSSQIVDYIDIPSNKLSAEDQIPEAIIVTTEEIPLNNSAEANAQIESTQPIQGI